MTDRAHVEQLAFPQDRALVGGVNGKRILYLSRSGELTLHVVKSDAFEIPRCPLVVAQAEHGPRGSASVQDVIDRIVSGWPLLRAVWWPPVWGHPGNAVISEEAIGVVMLDEARRQAPTPEEWEAAAGELRVLERRSR